MLPELGGVGHRTAQQRVAETLRHAILGGVLEPGTPLVLSELSERLGVSRTPIREAMRELAAEDLVDFDSYRSAVVHSPTLEEAREIYELRLELDPLAVRKAIVQITAEELDQAEAVHEQMLATNHSGDWVELNREFHRILLDASRSPRLTRIIGSLRNSAALPPSRPPSLRAPTGSDGPRQALRPKKVETAAERPTRNAVTARRPRAGGETGEGRGDLVAAGSSAQQQGQQDPRLRAVEPAARDRAAVAQVEFGAVEVVGSARARWRDRFGT